MARDRGYHNYRGRTSKGKIALAVMLILVILAAVIVILFQRHIVYDETGMPRLELPWQEEPSVEETDEALLDADLELTIQAPEEEAEEICAIAVPENPLTMERWQAFQEQTANVSQNACNAVLVTLKDSGGKVYFDSAAAVSGAVKMAEDTVVTLTELTGADDSFYAIAAISCFHDSRAANSDVEGMGLKNTGGYIFYDGNNQQWLDPGKSAARQYLCEIAKEAAVLGFDEILLTDVGYPTVGKLDKIYYGESVRTGNIAMFLEEMRTALEPYGVVLAIELPTAVISDGSHDVAGLSLPDIAPAVDRIYAAAEADQIEMLSAAVSAACETTVFIPKLSVYDPAISQCLIQ